MLIWKRISSIVRRIERGKKVNATRVDELRDLVDDGSRSPLDRRFISSPPYDSRVSPSLGDLQAHRWTDLLCPWQVSLGVLP